MIQSNIQKTQTHLLARFSSVAIINAIGAVLLIVLNVVLARLSGEQGVGTYNFVWAWIEILVVLSMLGLDKLVMRDVAYHTTNLAWAKLRGLLAGSFSLLLVATITCALASAVVFKFILPSFFTPFLLVAVLIGLIVIPFRALTFYFYGILIALRKSLFAQIPMFIGQPLFTILTFAAFVLFWGTSYATGIVAVTASAISACIVAIISFALSVRFLPKNIYSVKSEYDLKAWLKVSLPMMSLASMALINCRADIIMIGFFKDTDQAGIYAVSSRLSEFIRFGALAINPVVVGLIAQHHASNQREKLQRVVRSSARYLLLWAFVSLLAIFFLGSHFLSIFGQGFQAGYTALLILSIGQAMTIVLGPVDSILIMTGHHHAALIGLIVSTIVNLLLNVLLIPHYGMAGAAIATATSATIWSLVLAFAVIKRLHFRPFAF